MLERRLFRAVCATLAALAVTSAAAGATGVARIRQSDGSDQRYDSVTIRLNGTTLWLRSADGRGTLEVAEGACSFTGGLERCLPVSATLHQHGDVRTIALRRGTVYINPTDGSLPLRHSSAQLASRGVLVLLDTERGTMVSVTGTLDDVR